MKKCPFWSSDMDDEECFNECIMREADNDEECIFLEYLDDIGLEKSKRKALKKVILDKE